MPPEVCEAILRHHDLSVFDKADSDTPVVPMLVAIGCLAEHMNRAMVWPRKDEEQEGILEEALVYLGLSWAEYVDLREDAMALFD